LSYVNDILAEELPGPFNEFFGDSMTYTPTDGSPVSITAKRQDPNPQEPGVPGSVTAIKVVKSDLAFTPIKGDLVAIGSSNYSVFDVAQTPNEIFYILSLRVKRA
jgi:hypothetical protein